LWKAEASGLPIAAGGGAVEDHGLFGSIVPVASVTASATDGVQ